MFRPDGVFRRFARIGVSVGPQANRPQLLLAGFTGFVVAIAAPPFGGSCHDMVGMDHFVGKDNE